ncbi:hypothetical protein GPUN_0854 [Glaciecola punicea ACAM 611]|jgi:hypothetical protein|uniref:Uncharacterized protein n=1 Tax=Glaciecola punicea ACAM 611 TaxID=1121923 RepID=H5T9L2_9ALTE|nr:hypothetical protein GPUN_0854 [Glaciecola punicea ACAM 611]
MIQKASFIEAFLIKIKKVRCAFYAAHITNNITYLNGRYFIGYLCKKETQNLGISTFGRGF